MASGQLDRTTPPAMRRAAHAAPLSSTQVTLICLAMVLEGMSSSSINVQIAAIQTELTIGPVLLALVAGAFLVAYAGVLPAAGRFTDLLGPRPMLLAGVAAFGLGCVICTIAPAGWVLLIGRFVQGFGAALTAPAAMALITYALPAGPERNRAVARYAAMGAVGFSLGLVLPGVITSWVGWRAGFLITVPLVAVVLLATWTVRTGHRPSRARPEFGAPLLLTVGLMILVHALGGISTLPWQILCLEGFAVIVIGALLTRGNGFAGLPAEVAGHRSVISGCLAMAAIFAGVVSSTYVLSLGLQFHDQLQAYQVGLLILPQPVAFSLLSNRGARLVGTLGARPTMIIGAILLLVGLGYLQLSYSALPAIASVGPAMALIGAALAMFFPAASIHVVDAVPTDHRGTAAGLLTAAQNLGGALGLAAVTAAGLAPTVDNSLPTLRPGVAAALVLTAVGMAAACALFRYRPRHALAP